MVQEIHTDASSLRTLKIMPINLNEIVRSWIWLQEFAVARTSYADPAGPDREVATAME